MLGKQPDTMQIRVTTAFYYAGRALAEGEELTVPFAFGREMVACNRAVVVEPAKTARKGAA